MNDLIERQAAIETIEEHLRQGDEVYPLTETDKIMNHAFEVAASCVYNLPSAQQWIPCSERLPDSEAKTYWVCTDTPYQCECRWTNVNPFWTNKTTDWHWNNFDIPQFSKVVAWMPLPEPYGENCDEVD